MIRLDNALNRVIILDIMAKHTEPPPEPTVSELWRQWEPHQIVLTVHQCRVLGLERRSDVFEWLYGIGIQPDRYIVRKGRWVSGSIEIRFGYPEDISFVRMSGLIPD